MVLFQARHIYICEHHKNMIQSVRSKRKRKDSDDESEATEVRSANYNHSYEALKRNHCFISMFALIYMPRLVKSYVYGRVFVLEEQKFDVFLFHTGRLLSATGKHFAEV